MQTIFENMQNNIEELEKSIQNYEHLLTAAKKRLEEEKKKNNIEVGDYVVALKGSMFGDDGECVSKGKIYKVTQVGNFDFRFLNNFNRDDSWDKEKFRKATLAEIEKHLREKATQAGFIIGAKVAWEGIGLFIINSIQFYENKTDIQNPSSAYISRKNLLVARGANKYCSDHSAEICDKLILVKDEVEVNGYKAEYFDKFIKFGCAEIPVQMLIMLKKLYTPKHYKVGNRTLEGKIMIGKGEFNLEIITKLLNNHREKFGNQK